MQPSFENPLIRVRRGAAGRCSRTTSIPPLFAAILVAIHVGITAGAQPPHDAATIESLGHSPRLASEIAFQDERIEFRSPDGKTRQSLPLEELISIAWPTSADSLPDNQTANDISPASAILEFANGDRLRATVQGMNEEALRAEAFDQSLSIPLEQLRGIVWQEETNDDQWWPILHRTEGSDDVVLLSNGDRSNGQFTGMSEIEVTLLADGRSLDIARERIAAISFSPELTSVPQRPEVWQILQGPAGWLTVHDFQQDEQGELSAKTLFGETIAINPALWPRIRFFGPRIVSLLELEPSTRRHTPGLSQRWEIHSGRSVLNTPLELDGKIYPLGLGIHSETKIAYDLAGEFDTFSVTVGLAPAAGFRGDVAITLRVDDHILAHRENWRLADGPLELRDLSVSGGQSLQLEVGFGGNGDIRDLVNWCDPILVRTPANPTQR